MLKRMTSNKILKVMIALSVLCGANHAFPVKAQTEAKIDFVDRRGRVFTVTFSDEDLRRVEQDAQYVLRKLREANVECCDPRHRISDCIWECCDGTQVRTCDKILVKALNAVWGED